jgi:branched-subunit amino acid aminotransferase/4-amino-4-deoxychorismate lyase
MSEPLAYLGGRLLPQRDAALPLHDAGFVWGATVTDLARTFRHRLFRLADHLARFRRSCELARVPLAASGDELARVAEGLVAHNATLLGHEEDLALVMFATPGPVGYYLGEPGGPGDGRPTLGMHTFPLPLARYRRLFAEGARLVIPNVRAVPVTSVDPLVKQRSRLHWWLAEQEARQRDPGASALLLDSEGCLTEAAAANFLLVRSGTMLSPPSGSVLGGVSQQVVRELCGELGIPLAERRLVPDDLRGADEALLTSTSFCVAGVRKVDELELPWPGPVWQRLLAAWGKKVGVDIGRQILRDR